MFKANRLPSGNYRVQVIVKDADGHALKDENGKRIVKSFTASTEYEAMRKACEFVGQKQMTKELEEIRREEISKMTVYEAIERYLTNSESVLRPSTLRGYTIIQNTRLQPIKDMPIGSLLLSDIQAAVNRDSTRLCYKSIKEAVSLLQRVLTLNGISLNFKAITIPKDFKKKQALPSVEDVLKPLIGTKYELPCLLAMWCSLRMSEVRGLKYSDVTTKGNMHFLNVQRTRIYFDGEEHTEEKTKTLSSTRTIILPEYLYQIIISQSHKSDDDFIVSLGYNEIYKGFKNKMESIGYKDMTFHKLRHEFATTLNDLGIDGKYIQKLGGWNNPIVMDAVYTHTTETREREYQNRIDNHFRGIIDGLQAAL